jgi:hypothetical protein
VEAVVRPVITERGEFRPLVSRSRTWLSLRFPADPIGFIKRPDVLAEVFVRYFEPARDIRRRTSGHVILLGASRAWADAGGR